MKKSPSNKTEFDDALFFNSIIASFKILFAPPVEKPEKISLKKAKETFQKKGVFPIMSPSNGTVKIIEKDYLVIEHKNQIITSYKKIKPKNGLKEGEKISQMQLLGYAENDFEFSLSVVGLFEKK